MDTSLIRTLGSVPSVSVSERFDCTYICDVCNSKEALKPLDIHLNPKKKRSQNTGLEINARRLAKWE